MRRHPSIAWPALAPILLLVLHPRAARAEEVPRLAWGTKVRCMNKPSGEPVRVQCAPKDGKQSCLVAPNRMADSVGGDDLRRVQDCTREGPDAYRRLLDEGAVLVPAIAEAPPGYMRSENGRAFQVQFDLLNRVYVGVSWVPTFQRKGPTGALPPNLPLGRAQAETGLHISALSPRGRSRHDIRILEGTATIDDFELRGLLFSYDYQHLHRRPAFWLSTFLGKPRVHPVAPPVGWGFRVVNIHDRPPAFRDTLDVEFAEGHLSWNPWQSSDLYNHLRIEVGGDVGKYWEDRGELAEGLNTGLWYAGLSSAVKSRFTLGAGGLHYVLMDVNYFRPTALEGPTAGEARNRVDATVTYEAIFVAINDQPISLRVSAMGSTKGDPAADARNVEARFTAGLRFSFWAPPRPFEPLPEFEDP